MFCVNNNNGCTHLFHVFLACRRAAPLVVQMVLVHLLTRFQPSLPPDSQVHPRMMLTMRPFPDMKLVLRQRAGLRRPPTPPEEKD